MTSELDIYLRKIEREKKARLAAESRLEDYSREIYITNQSLKETQASTLKRQSELEFLHRAASTVNSGLSLEELVVEIVGLIGEFSQADFATWFNCEKQNFLRSSSPEIWSPEKGWHTNQTKFKTLIDIIAESDWDGNAVMAVVPVDSDNSTNDSNSCLIYIRVPLNQYTSCVLGFMLASDVVEEETLYALDTAKDHIVSGINRRQAEKKILKRNHQLEETIEKLELAQKQLIQSEKMASLGQLSAGVAHEINNPIGYIRSNFQVLGEYIDIFLRCYEAVDYEVRNKTLDGSRLSAIAEQFEIIELLEDSKKILETNLSGIDRVKEIVNGLKTFSHVGEEQQSLMSLHDCIDASLKIVNNELKYQHKVKFDVDKNLPPVIGNSTHLQQMFVNMFINAAGAMPQGGELKIKAIRDNDSILVTIEDNGCGMPEDVKNKIFTPFFTTKPVGSGTGLGLSISSAILEAHNVAIEVESTVGTGTKFSLYFPLADKN